MFLNIANYNITIENLTNYTFSDNHVEQVLNLFSINFNPNLNNITISLSSKINLPSHMYNRADAQYAEENETIFISSHFFDLSFNIAEQHCILHLKKMEPQFFYLLKAIKLVLSIIVIKDGGIPFHCSAVTDGNNGFIFTGKSGSGKTTAAILLNLSSYKLLNDEFNIILPDNESYKIYSTPFTTEKKFKICNNLNTSLSRIFFINKSKKNYIENNLNHIKFNNFLTSIYTFPTTRTICNKMLSNAEKLYNHINPELLYFINNNTFINDFERIIS